MARRRRKKTKWGPGNPLWEWQHRGRVRRKGLFGRVSRAARKPGRKKGDSMARRRRYRRRSSFGGGGLMRGKFQLMGGLMGAAISGAVLGYASKYVPVNVPYKTEVAGFLGGGIPGVIGATVAKGYGTNGNGNGIKWYG